MKRLNGFVLLALLCTPAALTAQYFGQNKVQYRAFDFKVLQTEHFDIYFYDDARAAALDAGRMAERSYARLSRVLQHQYKERKPIILYASHSDFQQTNALGGESPGEGTGGVTDFFKQRIVLPFTGSYEELGHVLQHEMVHQFQYDIWSRGKAGGGLQTIIAVNPPLWFVEGMAEYLSLGGVDPNTAMWLRDAALEGKLPTIHELETDPRIFPYRFGQALLAFIGERWGDESIGAILQGTLAGGGGLEGSVKRVIGLDFKQLSNEWHDAVQKRYLPEVGNRQKARTFANEVLTEDHSQGTYHLAPAISPDGSEIAYFSEKNFYFVDLYLADAQTGKVKRRLLKSSYSSNYETYRFINSQASWSPDGRYLAVAAKRGPKDDIVIIDVRRNKEARRIQVKLNGVTTPTWSPDGNKLVFTGYDGGLSDLFTINVDGSDLQRLTNDKYADLHPVWSPDGQTIAFATDRGPDTDFNTLRIGNMKVALYHLGSKTIEVLPHMEGGKNVSPQWSPDGRELAFVSDRTGVSNIYLFDLGSGQLYQITDLYTGAQGITPFSPVLSWSRGADRLAFVYYEKTNFDVYTIDNPSSLRKEPFQERPDTAPAVAVDTAPPTALALAPRDTARARDPLTDGGSLYRTPEGFRTAGSRPEAPDSTVPGPVSMAALLDSAEFNLPDTSEFSVKNYKVKYQPDYIARPSIGYTRDNFGSGIYGGTAITLSDILGNHNLLFSGYVNGRISEAQIAAAYLNLAHRINWATGLSQQPYYALGASQILPDTPSTAENTLVTNLRRTVYRSAFVEAYYPISRFRRVEMGFSATNISDRLQSIFEPYDKNTLQLTQNPVSREISLPGGSFVQPSLALTFDNSLQGYISPFRGRRWRVEVSQAVGSFTFTQMLADTRRYDHIFGPFTFATRALYFGRAGRDADRFTPIFLGHTDLLRGNTSGSYFNHECRVLVAGTQTGCIELDRLLGSQIAVASAELRTSLPITILPLEGALFYDVGLAWNNGDHLKFNRDPGDDPVQVRTPLQTFGASLRMNVLGFVILRLDYSIPQERKAIKGYWTLSIGPTF